jgi:phage terminase Nu1 subunit (DNA packaging protein)
MPRGVIRGAVKWGIIRDLAEGKSQKSIGRMYGLAQSSISEFAATHADEVDEVRGKLEDAYEGLWIADKKRRLAEYQAVAEEMRDLESESVAMGKVTVVEARRAQMAALRSVADELGAIPQRVQVEGGTTPVRHVLEGVDPEALA